MNLAKFDNLGNELNVGDEVHYICTKWQGKQVMKRSTIKKLNPSMASFEDGSKAVYSRIGKING